MSCFTASNNWAVVMFFRAGSPTLLHGHRQLELIVDIVDVVDASSSSSVGVGVAATVVVSAVVVAAVVSVVADVDVVVPLVVVADTAVVGGDGVAAAIKRDAVCQLFSGV